MEDRDSFIFYKSFYEAIEDVDDKSKLEIFNAICKMALYDEEVELKGISATLFKLIKPQLQANTKKFKDGKKGGRPKKETTGYEEEKTTGFENKKPNVNVNDNVNVNYNENYNDNVNVNDKYIASEEKSSTATAKASKHKYGKFKNVLLKDEELQSLKDNYNNWEELIEHLSYYIAMKGYKAKSHYLAIKKWVVNAVAEENARKTKTGGNPFFEILQEEGKL